MIWGKTITWFMRQSEKIKDPKAFSECLIFINIIFYHHTPTKDEIDFKCMKESMKEECISILKNEFLKK